MGRRRLLFFSVDLRATAVATWFMADLLWRGGLTGVEIGLLALFMFLLAHVAAGFCTAFVGFYVVNRGGDSSRIVRTIPPGEDPPLASTAIVMPVFNEDVSRVFEGLRVVYRSVQETRKSSTSIFSSSVTRTSRTSGSRRRSRGSSCASR